MFWERLESLLKEKNLRQTDLAKICNIKDGTISTWKKGYVPQRQTLKILADYFNVTTDYLLGYTDIKLKIEEKQIDEEEKQLIKNYNKANQETQFIIKKILNMV